VFVENHGLLFELEIVPYSINQPSRLCWIKMKIISSLFSHHVTLMTYSATLYVSFKLTKNARW